MDRYQQALAAEIRAEMGAQNVKAAPIQRALGISSTAWGTYFVQCTRDVPMSVVAGVAEYLGLKTSELLRRAEVRAGQVDPARDDLESGLSENGRRALEEGRRAVAGEGAESVDPPGTASERTRRSA